MTGRKNERAAVKDSDKVNAFPREACWFWENSLGFGAVVCKVVLGISEPVWSMKGRKAAGREYLKGTTHVRVHVVWILFALGASQWISSPSKKPFNPDADLFPFTTISNLIWTRLMQLQILICLNIPEIFSRLKTDSGVKGRCKSILKASCLHILQFKKNFWQWEIVLNATWVTDWISLT